MNFPWYVCWYVSIIHMYCMWVVLYLCPGISGPWTVTYQSHNVHDPSLLHVQSVINMIIQEDTSDHTSLNTSRYIYLSANIYVYIIYHDLRDVLFISNTKSSLHFTVITPPHLSPCYDYYLLLKINISYTEPICCCLFNALLIKPSVTCVKHLKWALSACRISHYMY